MEKRPHFQIFLSRQCEYPNRSIISNGFLIIGLTLFVGFQRKILVNKPVWLIREDILENLHKF